MMVETKWKRDAKNERRVAFVAALHLPRADSFRVTGHEVCKICVQSAVRRGIGREYYLSSTISHSVQN